MSDFLRVDFIKYYVPQIKDIVFAYMLTVHQSKTDMERNSKTSFKDVARVMQKLLLLIMHEDDIDKLLDGFNLDIALMSFQSNNLEKRLKGLKYIKRMVARANPKDDKK